MPNEIRFGAFVREVNARHRYLSYNHVTPRLEYDDMGNPVPYRAPAFKLRPETVFRLIRPYVQVRLVDQMRAVIPLALYLVLFQIIVLRSNVADAWIISAGLVAVILGLMFFMEGLRVGLMPFGESLGTSLPTRARLPVVLIIAFMLGIGVTFAEPAIGALKAAGAIVSVESAPYLYTLLNDWSEVLVLGVAYKKDISDVRESPALDILKILERKGASITYIDPHVPQLTMDGGKKYKTAVMSAKVVSGADCVVIVSDHTEFNYQWVVDKAKLVVDTRNATKNVKNGRKKIFKL